MTKNIHFDVTLSPFVKDSGYISYSTGYTATVDDYVIRSYEIG